jgi:hypothetical protein
VCCLEILRYTALLVVRQATSSPDVKIQLSYAGLINSQLVQQASPLLLLLLLWAASRQLAVVLLPHPT